MVMSIIVEYGRFDEMKFKNLDDFISAVAKEYHTEPKDLHYEYLCEYMKIHRVMNVVDIQCVRVKDKYGCGHTVGKRHRLSIDEIWDRIYEITELEYSRLNNSAKSFDKNDIDVAKNNKQKGAKEL